MAKKMNDILINIVQNQHTKQHNMALHCKCCWIISLPNIGQLHALPPKIKVFTQKFMVQTLLPKISVWATPLPK